MCGISPGCVLHCPHIHWRLLSKRPGHVSTSVFPLRYGLNVVKNSPRQSTGDAVVVTVPLGCLKAGDLRFQPPLPEAKLAAIGNLGYGLLNKVGCLHGTCFTLVSVLMFLLFCQVTVTMQ